ncbi:MAG TPA: hypothetical protein VMU26_22220 [Candidatus Polarisedimenticolia bacterium]|nr:hypothetical protein [Candidatus Polarisedimenticolia bacterium]
MVMDAVEIIKIINRRKDEFSDLQLIGTAEDPPVFSEAGVARAKADEYESLLAEIGGPEIEVGQRRSAIT